MPENKQPLDKHDENDRSTGTNIRTDLETKMVLPLRIKTMLIQQTEAIIGLTRALVEDWLATLWVHAGALANKRTVKGC